MRMFIQILAGLLCLLPVSCGSSRTDLKQPEAQHTEYRAVALQKYGPGVEFVFNESKTAVLCLRKSKPTAKDPQQQVSFVVFDLAIDSVIFEDEIPNGSVGWKDSLTVLVGTVPGIVKSDEGLAGQKSGYVFDLRSRKTRNLDASSIQ
jgi:hypothetical protein